MDEQQHQIPTVEYSEEYLERVRAVRQELAEGHVRQFDSAAELLAAIDAEDDRSAEGDSE